MKYFIEEKFHCIFIGLKQTFFSVLFENAYARLYLEKYIFIYIYRIHFFFVLFNKSTWVSCSILFRMNENLKVIKNILLLLCT